MQYLDPANVTHRAKLAGLPLEARKGQVEYCVPERPHDRRDADHMGIGGVCACFLR